MQTHKSLRIYFGNAVIMDTVMDQSHIMSLVGSNSDSDSNSAPDRCFRNTANMPVLEWKKYNAVVVCT
jgi:hypothetical protein